MSDVTIDMTPEVRKNLEKLTEKLKGDPSIKLEKVKTSFFKKYGAEALELIENKDKEALEKSISDAVRFIEEATGELEGQAEYKEAKENLKALKGALNDTVKPHKDAIKLAALLLVEKF